MKYVYIRKRTMTMPIWLGIPSSNTINNRRSFLKTKLVTDLIFQIKNFLYEFQTKYS
jgi:hypothetical protein